jgi:hypothetical protein
MLRISDCARETLLLLHDEKKFGTMIAIKMPPKIIQRHPVNILLVADPDADLETARG